MDSKTIIGIDPGTNVLGYGVIRVEDGKPHYVDMGLFDLRKIKEPYDKLANIFAGVKELIATYSPDEFAVESPFYGKNVQVVLKLGRAQGAAITAAATEGIPVHEYPPSVAKISICGNGGASKEQVSTMLSKTLNVTLNPERLDATDALAIAMAHYYTLFNPLAAAGGRSRKSSSWKAFIAENGDRVKK